MAAVNPQSQIYRINRLWALPPEVLSDVCTHLSLMDLRSLIRAFYPELRLRWDMHLPRAERLALIQFRLPASPTSTTPSPFIKLPPEIMLEAYRHLTTSDRMNLAVATWWR